MAQTERFRGCDFKLWGHVLQLSFLDEAHVMSCGQIYKSWYSGNKMDGRNQHVRQEWQWGEIFPLKSFRQSVKDHVSYLKRNLVEKEWTLSQLANKGKGVPGSHIHAVVDVGLISKFPFKVSVVQYRTLCCPRSVSQLSLVRASVIAQIRDSERKCWMNF